ncbi:heparin lyase I family protein [Chroococcidiopsis sp. FACHB-1243]|uniref:heparin lyase I family protein n=1 Tax=Chroococcidiopsis sp. [FACHB-1243] TaxID=2692781 RepID=UPI00178309A8|nr:heparin lyase I family protein [Chroococcidiopsis sp. [FACHB-1243]]MBD2305484.1 heparin lyase I family protein [Chroococcidiopsis sp. [FACHB-1243]]
MNTKGCNHFFIGVLALCTTFLCLPEGVHKSDAKIIDSVITTVKRPELGKGGSACQKLATIPPTKGNGQKVFKHWVDRCGERSEMATKKTKIGETYWYGWSMFVPSTWKDTDAGFDIVNQFGAFPSKKGRRYKCGGIGSKISRQGSNFIFDLQRQGNFVDVECTKFNLAKVSQLRGQWTDFVMQVKWTGNKDGFLKLWMKTGNGNYVQKINHQGATFWNDEGTGPYFKMGLYKGNPNFKGPAPRSLYTAEYRLGDANSSFKQVVPRLSKQKIAER